MNVIYQPRIFDTQIITSTHQTKCPNKSTQNVVNSKAEKIHSYETSQNRGKSPNYGKKPSNYECTTTVLFEVFTSFGDVFLFEK